MKSLLIGLATTIALHAGTAVVGTPLSAPWSGITIDVLSDRPVEPTQRWREQADGFHRLEITLTNPGTQPLTIEKITVHIPLAERLAENLEMLYGGSCMGRTPLLRQPVGAQTKLSSSHMYEMLRLADGQYLFAGSLSWRIFMPNFTVKDGEFVVWSHGEGKQLKPGESIQYEQIVLRRSSEWLPLLNQFGSAIAKENGITKLKNVDYKGWASWDYYGSKFSADDLLRNLEKIKQLFPAANLFQIDAGWSPHRGDLTTVRADLIGGMKAMAQKIKATGMTPGIWIDGFRGAANSDIYKKHPEFFLRDQDDKVIVSSAGDVYFDYSHPEARAYMAECIRVITREWGFPYLKVDFMRFGLESDIKTANKQVKSIRAHDPALTSVERIRLGMQTMREAMGPDIYFLGCSAVFGPCIGFVDGMRTGADIHPEYVAFPERALGNLGHFYLNGKVFNADADYLVFRAAADEDEKVSPSNRKHGGSVTVNEAKMWGDFVSLYGTCQLSSDNLMTLRPERQALLPAVFSYPAMDESIPLDVWQRAAQKNDGFELVLSRKGNEIYLGVFNWSDTPKEYALAAFGKSEPVKLSGRHSVILKYAGKDSFAQLCQKLQSR